MYSLMAMAAPVLGSGWQISSFLKASQETLAYYGSIVTSIIGVAMVIVGIFQVAKNLISHGKGQTNWVVTFALILVGGALAIVGGWRMIGNFAEGSKTTLDNMAKGSAETSGGEITDPFNQGGGGSGGGGGA